MNRDAITSSRYSPGNLPGELLERLFVAREPLLRDVLDRIASSLTRGSQYFQLLVGPRGAGKTHLLALLRHRLLTEARFVEQRPKLCLAPLNEEEWGVASYLDLLVRVLRAIATQEGDDSLRASIDDLHERHTRAPERSVAHAEDLLTKHVGKRTLVVLCENLDEILRGIGDEGQKRWRASMQQRKHWNVVATTTALSDALQEHNSPFYNFFHIRQLDRLDLAAATALMRRKAEVDGKHDLAELLDTSMGRARLRAIHHLAGGNSRVYVILSEFLTKDSLDALWPAFLRTIDDLTPYYQDRIRQLAPAQRKIVECLCQAVHAIRVKDIAGRCLMSQQTAAKQLSELTRLRYVEGSSRGRETFYELTEPLLRICIDVKDNRTRHLRTFVELMRHWFSVGEMEERLKGLEIGLRGQRPVDRLHLEVALEEAKREGTSPHLTHLHEEATVCEQRGDHAGAAELLAKLVVERGWVTDYSRLADSLSALDHLDKAEATLRLGIRQHTKGVFLQKRLAGFLMKHGRCDEAFQVLNFTPATRRDRDGIDAIKSEILRAEGRTSEAAALDRAIVKRGTSVDLNLRTDALERLGRNSEAIALLNDRLARQPKDLVARDSLGWILMQEQQWELMLQNESALPAGSLLYNYSEYRRSYALAELGRAEEALEVLRRWVARDPESARARGHLATQLLRLGRYAEALQESQEAQRLAPEVIAHCESSAMCLLSMESNIEALRLIDASIERAPLRGSLHALRGMALDVLGRLDEARHAFLTAAHLAERGQVLLLGVNRAWERGEWQWVLGLCEAMPSTRSPTPSWSKVHARALVGVGRAEDALRLIEPLAENDVEAASLARLAAFTLKPDDCDGPRVLAALASLTPEDQKDLWVFQLLLGVMGTHGTSVLSGLVRRLRANLEIGGHLAQSLSALLVFLSNRHEFITADMEHELPMLLRAIDGLPGSEVIGPALSVVVRYTRTHDPVVLLELPREVRELLLPALAPPAPVGATSDSSTHSPRAN